MPTQSAARQGFIICCFFSALLCISLLGSRALAAEPWPTTEFEVFIGDRTTTSNSLLNDLIRTLDDYRLTDPDFSAELINPVTRSTLDEIERHMGEVARTLEAQGFRAPLLEPIITREDGTRAYRLYLFDMRDKEGKLVGDIAKYSAPCGGGKRPVILLNAGGILQQGKLTDKAYQDLPHELFHAVQKSYPLFRDNCYLGDWIVEGTAQALGADLAAWSSVRKNYPHRIGVWMRDRWGRRAYDFSLWIPDNSDESLAAFYERNPSYGASSFWRYLGEYVATAGAAGTLSVKPDYRYLQDFFNSELPGRPGEVAEYQWIESMLRLHPDFKTGLSRIYPNFITTFASYVPARINPKAGFPMDVQDKWLGMVFPMDQCPVVKLSGTQAVYRGRLGIAPNAANCIRLDLGYNKPVDVSVTFDGPDKTQLRAVSVGTAGGQVVSKPWIKSYASRESGSWILNFSEIPLPGQALPLLIFSNVASAPEASVYLEGDLELSTAAFKHSMLPEQATAAGPTKPQPATGKSGAQGGELVTTATQMQRVGADIDAGLDDMNPNLAHGSTVRSEGRKPPCKEAFVTTSCGPTTSVTLSVMPGLIGSTMQSTGRGGVFGQYMSMLSGIAEVGALEASRRQREAYEKMAAVDGAEVHITIPLIDYGYSGRFNNAEISVSKAGGGSFVAIGPGDLQPGPGRVFPLSGSVSIEQFTPDLMQGTFSAALVDPADAENLGEDEALPVREQISGRFQIVAPWALDERIPREAGQEGAGEAVTADVGGFFPGVNLESGETLASKSAGQGASAGGQLGCYCSCNAMSELEQACQAQCAPVALACTGERASAATLAALAFKPKRVDAAEEMAAGEPYLLSLPEASVVLDAQAAAKMLESSGASVRAQDWLPEVLSSVNWKSSDNARHQVTLDLRFQPLDVFDSRSLSQEEFEQAALGFKVVDLKTKKALTKLGAKAFRADLGDYSELHVLTGIYGKAHDGDDFGSELVLSLQLVHPEQTHMMRYVRMRGFIKPVVERLRELALGSHQASAWPVP